MADTSKENVARMAAHFRKHDWAVVSHARGTEKASELIEALAAERDALAERVRVLEDKAENAVIAFGMGWDMEGVMEALRAANPKGPTP
jgi:hypothetical protein